MDKVSCLPSSVLCVFLTPLGAKLSGEVGCRREWGPRSHSQVAELTFSLQRDALPSPMWTLFPTRGPGTETSMVSEMCFCSQGTTHMQQTLSESHNRTVHRFHRHGLS